MMKKTGFTLAEVLITLTIIGVVAMMTLPALMSNVQEQQAITGLKKGINTIVDAGSMNAATQGFDYSTSNSAELDDAHNSITNLFINRLNVDATTSGIATAVGNDGVTTWQFTQNGHTQKVLGGANNGAATVLFLRDGSAIVYTTATAVSTAANNRTFDIFYDINGEKGPNLISNCSAQDASAPTAETVTAGNCNTQANRIIRDQFQIHIVRGNIEPIDGSIVQWILANK